MTNPTPHGQVPDALRLAEEITNLECSSEAVAKTIAAAADELCRLHTRIAELEAQIEALSGVQALSAAPEAFLKSVIALCSHRGYSPANIEAWDKDDKWIADLWRQAESMLAASPTPQAISAAPAGWKLVPVNPTPEMWKAAKSVPDPNPPYPPHYGLVWDAMLAASPTPPAEQQAPRCSYCDGTGDVHGIDGEWRGICTECDAGTALRQQAAPKAAPVRACVCGEPQASGTVHRVDGPCYVAAPQQEAQEPVAYVHVPHYPVGGKVRPVVSFEKYQQDYADGIYSTRIPLYTSPQPAPAPLSDAIEHYLESQDALDNREYAGINAESYETLIRRRNASRKDLDAAIAAQGGKV